MEKPIGPPNIKVNDDPNFNILFLFSILLLLFVAGASTCKVTSWSAYKSQEDCVVKMLSSAMEQGNTLDINNVTEYCKRYDR